MNIKRYFSVFKFSVGLFDNLLSVDLVFFNLFSILMLFQQRLVIAIVINLNKKNVDEK